MIKIANMKHFLEVVNSEYVKNHAQYMIIEVKIGKSDSEIIINSKSNFESKINYYQSAYDEDFVLKANSDVKIVNYVFVKDLRDFFNYFMI